LGVLQLMVLHVGILVGHLLVLVKSWLAGLHNRQQLCHCVIELTWILKAPFYCAPICKGDALRSMIESNMEDEGKCAI